jgi:hypothetical protein
LLQGGQGRLRSGNKPHAARFQFFEMENRGVEQLVVVIGHGLNPSGDPDIQQADLYSAKALGSTKSLLIAQ